jgi:hypothetical protein
MLALSVIRTHDPSVRAAEDISCLRPRGHCDKRPIILRVKNGLRIFEKKVLKEIFELKTYLIIDKK